MKRTFIPLLLLALLTACAPMLAPEATPTATLPPPTQTPQPTATATITPTPTPNANDIADNLGLRSEDIYRYRSFEIRVINDQSYLVDTYNNAPKAILESGLWRKLDFENPADAEVMYGQLVPFNIEYISPELLDYRDGSVTAMAQMVFLGEIIWHKEQYKGESIDMAYLLVGLRDREGNLHIAKYGADAPWAGQPHWYNWHDVKPSNGFWGNNSCNASFIEMILSDCWIKPGDLILNYDIKNPGILISGSKAIVNNDWPLSNLEYRDINSELFNQNKNNMMTVNEWERLLDGEWPDRLIVLYPTDVLTILTSPENWE